MLRVFSYKLLQVSLSRDAQNNIRTNLRIIKRRPTFYQLASSRVSGPQFLKEKKQTLDMPLLLDSGKN